MLNLSQQKLLHRILSKEFDIPNEFITNKDEIISDFSTKTNLEEQVLSSEEKLIPKFTASETSKFSNGIDFTKKIKYLINNHTVCSHSFYDEFLPNKATIGDLSVYLAQESLQDPRFDDFIAHLQMGLPVEIKMMLAENYWDEMGNGDQSKVHTVMFDRTAQILGITNSFINNNLTTDGLLCGNLSALLVLRRDLFYRAIGYFATIEYMFPKRCLSLISAWHRLGLNTDGITYHKEHVKIDAIHAAAFFNNVIAPLVDGNPACAAEIYWGVYVRLNTSGRHLDDLIARLLPYAEEKEAVGLH